MARPGVVIGRGGSTLKSLQEELENMIEVSKGGNKGKRIGLDVVEVENAEQEAAVVAQRIADQLVKRYPSRRAVSQALDKVRQVKGAGD